MTTTEKAKTTRTVRVAVPLAPKAKTRLVAKFLAARIEADVLADAALTAHRRAEEIALKFKGKHRTEADRLYAEHMSAHAEQYPFFAQLRARLVKA